MEYKYFVSYFNTTNKGFGFGRCEITTEEKIECIDDIKYLEEKILKDNKQSNELSIINYQLMKTIKKGVE